MAADPRPHTARTPDGREDQDTEARFEVIFAALMPPRSPRPTDAASTQAFLAELWDRLNGTRK